jgi:hypothetical protein
MSIPQRAGHRLKRGLRSGIGHARIEVGVFVGDLGVDGVDEAFVAAVVAVGVDLAHGRVLAELRVLEVPGDGDDGCLAGLGIHAEHGKAVRSPSGAVISGVAAHHQEVVPAFHGFHGGSGGKDAADRIPAHVEQVGGVAE